MKKYNIQNYIRYKEDLKESIPIDKLYKEYIVQSVYNSIIINNKN